MAPLEYTATLELSQSFDESDASIEAAGQEATMVGDSPDDELTVTIACIATMAARVAHVVARTAPSLAQGYARLADR
jgi:hypothetical protein